MLFVESLDVSKIDRIESAPGELQASEPPVRLFVDNAVVFHGRDPTGSTHQANGLHQYKLLFSEKLGNFWSYSKTPGCRHWERP
jgi:hypothetical protein